jgi:transposase
MRGSDADQGTMFSYLSPEERVPPDHPLRVIRGLVDPILVRLSPQFAAVYARGGRPSIAPEKLLRALLLQVLYTIRSERQLMEHLDYNILYRWFVGLNLDDPVWVPTVFTKNRERLLRGHIADAFLAEVLAEAERRGLLSNEHFTVDGTLLEAWASHKSFQRKDGASSRSQDDDPGNPTGHFRGEKRRNATHASVTDPECRLAKKSAGKGARLSYQGSVVIDNRHGLVVATDVTQPGYDAECRSALAMLQRLPPPSRRRTVGGDKGYDRPELVAGLRALGVTPHVAQNVHRTRPQSAIDGRTTRHPGYAVSQRKRKVVEESFGWGKVVGPLRKLHVRGTERVSFVFTFAMAAYDLVRMRTLSLAGGGS